MPEGLRLVVDNERVEIKPFPYVIDVDNPSSADIQSVVVWAESELKDLLFGSQIAHHIATKDIIDYRPDGEEIRNSLSLLTSVETSSLPQNKEEIDRLKIAYEICKQYYEKLTNLSFQSEEGREKLKTDIDSIRERVWAINEEGKYIPPEEMILAAAKSKLEDPENTLEVLYSQLHEMDISNSGDRLNMLITIHAIDMLILDAENSAKANTD